MIRALPVSLVLLASALAQDSRPESVSSRSHKLTWPRDRERKVASVDGETLSLDQLVVHLDERHAPGFRTLLDEPGMQDLGSAKAPAWVRAFADAKALAAEARSRNLDAKLVERSLSEALKAGFQLWLQRYEEERGKSGNPVTLTQERVNKLLALYQKDSGLETEVQGYLDALVPDDSTEGQLHEFYTQQARIFGGLVTFAHILVRDRDPLTLELLDDTLRKKADERMADIRARLAADGSNFEEVARRYSDDRVSAKRGGLFENVERFDARLPAALCRTAWRLRDGEWIGPIESPYGQHFVKRISFLQDRYILYCEQIKPEIRATLRKWRQESLLFEVREKRRVKLLY